MANEEAVAGCGTGTIVAGAIRRCFDWAPGGALLLDA